MQEASEFYNPGAGRVSRWLYNEWLWNEGQYARIRYSEHKEVLGMEEDAVNLYTWRSRHERR